MDKSESDFWWLVKGICILAVIAIHSVMNVDINNVTIFIRQFINFPVILFIFMSGYFVNASNVLKNSKEWLIKRMRKIAIPYIIFSIIYLVYAHFINGVDMNYKGIIASLLLGTSAIHMYFCIVMIQLILLTPFWVKNCLNRRFCYIGGLFFSIICVIFKYLNVVIPNSIANVLDSFCGSWFIFYIYGIYIGNNIETVRTENDVYKKKNMIYLLVAVALLFIESYIEYNNEQFRVLCVSQKRLSNFLVVYVVINILVEIKKKKLYNKFLIMIGKASFGIYLLHMLILDTLLLIFPRMPMLFLFFITSVLSVCICYYWKEMCRKRRIS